MYVRLRRADADRDEDEASARSRTRRAPPLRVEPQLALAARSVAFGSSRATDREAADRPSDRLLALHRRHPQRSERRLRDDLAQRAKGARSSARSAPLA